MERLQVYNRKTNSWGPRYMMEVGFSENWVLDKTTDTAKDIRIRYPGEAAPDWDIMDWVRILHIDDEHPDEAMTYDADGAPLNSNQYVIAGIQCVNNQLNGNWIVSLDLIEPIERFKGIIGETLSYTNQTKKDVYNPATGTTTTYTREAYNHYTALERWLKVTPANCDSYAFGYNRNNNVSWFNRIRLPASDMTFLSKLPFADATYNALSLYELLLDVYDASTGRTPVAYFDIDPATDLPYNPARDEYMVRFERQDGLGAEPLLLADLKQGCSMETKTKSLDNYATGLVSDVENLNGGAPIKYPNEHLFAVPEAVSGVRDTTGLSTPGSDEWAITFPHPIKRITKVVRMTMDGKHEFAGDVYRILRYSDDLTKYTYEKRAYQAAGESFNFDPTKSSEVLWYEEGGDKLYVKDYVYETTGGIEDTRGKVYYVEYEPLISARLLMGSSEYVQPVNQSYSQVDGNKFGNFLQGYLSGMNKADLLIAKTYQDPVVGLLNSGRAYNRFKDFLGRRVIDGTRTYLITAVSYKNRNFCYDVFLQLNENHFRKNSAYQAPQDIRPSIDIPYMNLCSRKIALKKTIRLGLQPIHGVESSPIMFENDLIPISAFIPEQVSSEYCPQIARITAQGIATPVVSRTFTAIFAKAVVANQVNISYRTRDNALLDYKKQITLHNNVTYEEPFKNVEKQMPLLFSDYLGELKTLSLIAGSRISAPLDDINYGLSKNPPYNNTTIEDPPGRDRAAEYAATLAMYEAMAELDNTYTLNPAFSVTNQVIYKDVLEQLNENFVFEYLSDDAIVGAGAGELSRLMRQVDEHMIGIACFDKPVSLDTKTEEAVKYITESTATLSELDKRITYSFDPFTTDFESAIIYGIKGVPYAPYILEYKMLILNRLNPAQIASIKAGSLSIYYNV